jgi:hypothetical protein
MIEPIYVIMIAFAWTVAIVTPCWVAYNIFQAMEEVEA